MLLAGLFPVASEGRPADAGDAAVGGIAIVDGMLI